MSKFLRLYNQGLTLLDFWACGMIVFPHKLIKTLITNNTDACKKLVGLEGSPSLPHQAARGKEQEWIRVVAVGRVN